MTKYNHRKYAQHKGQPKKGATAAEPEERGKVGFLTTQSRPALAQQC